MMICSRNIARVFDLFRLCTDKSPINILALYHCLGHDGGPDIRAYKKGQKQHFLRTLFRYDAVTDLEKAHFLYFIILLGDVLLNAHEDASQIVRGCKRTKIQKASDAVDIFKGLGLDPGITEYYQSCDGQKHIQFKFNQDVLNRITFVKSMEGKIISVTIQIDGTQYFRARFVQRLQYGLKAIHDLEVKKD